MRRSLVMLLVVAAGGPPGHGSYPPPGRLVDVGGRRFRHAGAARETLEHAVERVRTTYRDCDTRLDALEQALGAVLA